MTVERARAIASAFGVGTFPVAPGTAGTLVAVPLALGLALLPTWIRACVLAASLPWAAAVCRQAASRSADGDPSWVVLDEIIGYCIAVAWSPVSVPSYAVGFLLFRLFDILKPPPAGWLDRKVAGGWGILLDDVCAGIYAAGGLALLRRLGAV